MSDYIALIRCNPSPEDALRLSVMLSAASRDYESSLVFLHGDGATAVPGTVLPGGCQDMDWCACRTSWMRRSGSADPKSTVRLATLVTLLEKIATARRVDSFGFGGWYCCKRPSGFDSRSVSRGLLLEVDFAPADERRHRETLELALGAAALELDASVLFRGAGIAHVEGDRARGWRQITDFGLLDVFVETRAGQPQPSSNVIAPANALGAREAARLRAGAGTILLL